MADEELVHVYALTGEFIQSWARLESALDTVLIMFFEMSGPVYGQFDRWILRRMGTGAKLEVVRLIVGELDDAGIDTKAIRATLSDVDRLKQRRDVLAHRVVRGSVIVDEEGRRDGPLVQAGSKNAKPETDHGRFDLEGVQAELAQFEPVGVRLMALLDAVATLRGYR